MRPLRQPLQLRSRGRSLPHMRQGAGIGNYRDTAMGVLVAVVLAHGENGVIRWGLNRLGSVWGDRKQCDHAKGLARWDAQAVNDVNGLQ